jgi:hypothetical protein
MLRVVAVIVLVVVGLGGLSAAEARTVAARTPFWIVLSSDRDGQTRGYSIRPDGSRLSPLVAGRPPAGPTSVSGDGRTLAYFDEATQRTYVSHANGKRFRRLRISASADQRLSRDGRLLAFEDTGIWIVGSDGHGLRRLTSNGQDQLEGWSPDGQALLVIRSALLVKPLGGNARVVVPNAGVETAAWSPDGRWIAYSTEGGVYAVQPDGTQRRRLTKGYAGNYAWSPDGRMLVVAVGDRTNAFVVVGLDGRTVRRLDLSAARGRPLHVAWSPDGQSLAFDVDRDFSFHNDIWVVGADGRGLQRLTKVGRSFVVGWTPLAPVQPTVRPLLPTASVSGANTIATRTPVDSLSADGRRVAFTPGSTGADCAHVAVWTPRTRKLDRFSEAVPCVERLSDVSGVFALAGSRATWIDLSLGGNCQGFRMVTAALGTRRLRRLASGSTPCGGLLDYHLHGDGGLLVFNDGSRDTPGYNLDPQRAKLFRVGTDGKPSVIRTGEHACCADSVSDGRVAINERGAVAVLDSEGAIVRVLPFAGARVSAALLDHGRLVVSRSSLLEVYDVQSGARQLQRSLPRGYELADVDGGIAVLRGGAGTTRLLRLADGRSYTVPNRAGLADLEPPGLYYSYTTAAGEGRVVFVPRTDIVRRLGGS